MEKEKMIKYFNDELINKVNQEKKISVKIISLKKELSEAEQQKRNITDGIYQIKTALQYLGVNNV